MAMGQNFGTTKIHQNTIDGPSDVVNPMPFTKHYWGGHLKHHPIALGDSQFHSKSSIGYILSLFGLQHYGFCKQTLSRIRRMETGKSTFYRYL